MITVSLEQIPSLKTIYNPPAQLFVEGNADLLRMPCISIVGTRNASAYGIRAAMHFAKELAGTGFCIVSGLARGIDTAAHKGALIAKGKTIAVLGHGLSMVYPAENLRLARQIVEEGGCLVSEYPPETEPYKSHFPQRNRIIAGLGLGTLVIEAREKSGSLITAKLALENGKDVFIAPGGFDAPGFRGSHLLIQEGAKLVVDCTDILTELGVEWVPADIKKPVSSLYPYFVGEEGSVSLEDLFLKSSLPLSEVINCLREAIECGDIAETFPQAYSWVGRSGKEGNHANEQGR